MSLTPLATVEDFLAGPFKTIAEDLSADELTRKLNVATRHIEASCDRRLALFTNLQESSRLDAVAVDDVITTFQPMEEMATLGYSRAMSLDGGNLVRHQWIHQKPPIFQDMWLNAQSGTTLDNITSILLRRSFSGDEFVNTDTIQYEYDTGHIRYALGTYAPPGTTVIVTYSGGYETVPDDLVEACIFEAAKNIIVTLQPTARPDVALEELDTYIDSLIIPYQD